MPFSHEMALCQRNNKLGFADEFRANFPYFSKRKKHTIFILINA